VVVVDWISLMTEALKGPAPSWSRNTLVLGVICQEALVVMLTLSVPTVTPPATSLTVMLLAVEGGLYCAVSPWPLGMTPPCQFVDVLQVPPLDPIHWPITAACAADETNTLAAPATTAKPTDFRITLLPSRRLDGCEY
jgi:hypothetical protein